MPSIRSSGHKLINFPADQSLADALDEYCRRANVSKSQFIRDAIWEKLPPDLRELAVRGAPSRLGKGGPKPRPRANGKGDYPEHREQFSTVEERPSSEPDAPPPGTSRAHMEALIRTARKAQV